MQWNDGSLTTFIQRPLLSLFRAVGGLVNSLFNIKIRLTLNIGVKKNLGRFMIHIVYLALEPLLSLWDEDFQD